MRGGVVMCASCGELFCNEEIISWSWFIWMVVVIYNPEYNSLKATRNARIER
jgi:hypothetical protein